MHMVSHLLISSVDLIIEAYAGLPGQNKWPGSISGIVSDGTNHFWIDFKSKSQITSRKVISNQNHKSLAEKWFQIKITFKLISNHLTWLSISFTNYYKHGASCRPNCSFGSYRLYSQIWIAWQQRSLLHWPWFKSAAESRKANDPRLLFLSSYLYVHNSTEANLR